MVVFEQMDCCIVSGFDTRLWVESTAEDEKCHDDDRELFFGLAEHRDGGRVFGTSKYSEICPHDGNAIEGGTQDH